MLKLYKSKFAKHSLFWLLMYLLINTVTGNIASSISIEPYIAGAVPNLLLAVICLLYLKRTQTANEIGLFTKTAEKSTTMLFYIPVLILPFLSLFYGINKELSLTEILLLLAMYTGVGFMEEVIFRGLMFKELSQKWNRYVVVAFISFTFAIGHIVSIVAISQSAGDTMLQIINAFVVGFMFMAVILASGNLKICIITHILYNFIAGISRADSTHTEIIFISLIITVLYFVYLLLCSKNVKAYFKSFDLL